MFHITSNIDEIIGEFEAFQKTVETGHQAAVLKPQIYLPYMQEAARTVLASLMTEAEAPSMDNLLGSITAWVRSDTAVFELMGLQGAQDGVVGDSGGLGDIQPGDLGWERLKPLRDDIEAWVREKKDKTQTDLEHWPTDEALADHIIGTLRHKPQDWTLSQDPDGLIAYLRQRNPEMFEQVFGLTSLGNTRLTELLQAVLEAWLTIVPVHAEAASLEYLDKALA